MMIRLRWVDLLTLRWVPVAFVLVGNTRTSTASGSDMICFETTNPYAAYQENPTCTNAIRHPPPPPPRPDCNLYMAESTIPGAGLGLFTAIPRNKGDSLHNDEVYIPILDLSWHQGKINGDYFDTTAAYVWNTYSDGSGIESEGAWTGGIMAYWPGWGAAINCHFGINNLVASASSSHHGNVHMHRLTNPGAGAYSYYHAQEAFAYRAIPAGGELFRSYGDAYFLEKSAYDGIPVAASYETATEILGAFSRLLKKNKEWSLSLQVEEEVYKFIHSIVSTWDTSTRLLHALPNTYSDAQIVMDSVGDFAVLHQAQATRPLDWLQDHGTCIDHIQSGPSTLEHAGTGAFAKRFLPKGTLITASPLHHMFRNLTEMYELPDSTQHARRQVQRAGQQLLLNYCFGRPQESTLLLCPYGSGVNFINHNQTLANVEIRWAADGTSSHNATWLSMKPSEMAWNYKISLGFDYVAVDDIAEGQELFMDYGDAWETAWREHVYRWNNYNPQSSSEQWQWSYQSAAQLNAQSLRDNEPLRTQEEQVHAPYPSNLRIRCHSELETEPEDLDHNLDTFGENSCEDEGEEGPSFDGFRGSEGRPCTIVDRWKSNVTSSDADKDSIVWYYDVQLILEGEDVAVRRRGVPRRAISFEDAPYTTDMHLKDAFRHEIVIPNALFPPAWKDVRNPPTRMNPPSTNKTMTNGTRTTASTVTSPNMITARTSTTACAQTP